MNIKERYKEKFDREFKRGLEGKNVGILLPLSRLSDTICNLQQGTYTLVGGGTGTGKSTLINECYINHPIQFVKRNPHLNLKVKICYFNLEMSSINVIAKFRANWIFRETKAKIKLSINHIFQRGGFKLTEEEKQWVTKSQEYQDSLLDDVEFIAGEKVGSGFVYKKLWEYAKEYGIMEKKDGKDLLYTWRPKDENQYIIFVFDNLNNLPSKEEIDNISQYFVDFRNSCNFSFTVVQQYNRANEGMDRREFMIPQLSDLMTSSKPGHDCNIALLTYSPARYMLNDYEGYNMLEQFGTEKLGEKLRFLRLSKSRDGRDNVYIPYMFDGARGYVKEMPLPNIWNKNENNIKQQYENLFI